MKLAPIRKFIVAGTIVGLVLTIIKLYLPLLIGNLLTTDGIQTIVGGSYKLIILAVIIVILVMGLNILTTLLLGYAGASSVELLQQKFFDHVFALSISDLNRLPRGDLSSRLINDVSSISKVISVVMPDILLNSIIGVGTLLFLFSINWELTLMVLGLIPLLVLINYPVDKKIERLFMKQQQILGDINDRFTGALANIRLVKAYNAEKQEHYRFYQLFRQFKNSFKKILLYGSSLSVLSESFVFLYILGILVFLAYQFYRNNVTFSEIVTFFGYILQVIEPMMSLQSDISEYFGAKASYQRLYDINVIGEESNRNRNNTLIDGSIVFEEVSFGYNENHRVLNQLSFSIPDGAFVSIIGPSGAGKTTVFSLIESYYTYDTGRLWLGKHEMSELSPEVIRDAVAYVSQDALIIPGTVRENLIYGKNRTVTDEEIYYILQKTGLSCFIKGLDQGLDTLIGDGGHLLSEGQKQKLNIARALLSDPKILLMDEMSANLHVQSEEDILHTVEAYKGQFTIVLIAHRLKTIKHSDQIIVLDSEGQIVAIGTHETLMQTNQSYRENFENS